MAVYHGVALGATIILGVVIGLQLLLAAGLPLGRAAWRGQYRVLPTRLRWASLATVAVLGLAAWVVLARAGLVAPGAAPAAIRVAAWLFAGMMALNTLGNSVSQSPVERYAMTPVTLILAACFVVVAMAPSGVAP